MSTAAEAYRLDASQDYPFVPTTEEHRRLNEQSAGLNGLMLGAFSRAPLHRPTKILDIGCGTGIQTRLLAEKYPEATVIGIDPNPVPESDSKATNVVFILGRIEELMGKHELLTPNSFDLIYQRFLILAIHDWTKQIKSLQPLLKPSAWLEFQEIDPISTYDAHGQLVSDDWRFPGVNRRGMQERGIDLDIAWKLPDIFHEVGCVEIRCDTFPNVVRPGWRERPETERTGSYCYWALQPMYKMLLARSARPAEGEDAEELYREFEEKVLNGPLGYHFKFIVTLARMPAN